jgi:hypothetical protein
MEFFFFYTKQNFKSETKLEVLGGSEKRIEDKVDILRESGSKRRYDKSIKKKKKD